MALTPISCNRCPPNTVTGSRESGANLSTRYSGMLGAVEYIVGAVGIDWVFALVISIWHSTPQRYVYHITMREWRVITYVAGESNHTATQSHSYTLPSFSLRPLNQRWKALLSGRWSKRAPLSTSANAPLGRRSMAQRPNVRSIGRGLSSARCLKGPGRAVWTRVVRFCDRVAQSPGWPLT